MKGIEIDLKKIEESLGQEVQSIKAEYDEENNVLNLYVVPKKSLEFIDINFVISPTGTSFQ